MLQLYKKPFTQQVADMHALVTITSAELTEQDAVYLP